MDETKLWIVVDVNDSPLVVGKTERGAWRAAINWYFGVTVPIDKPRTILEMKEQGYRCICGTFIPEASK